MATGREYMRRDDGKKRSIQGKVQTKVLIEKAMQYSSTINEMQTNANFDAIQKRIIGDLTCDTMQFKIERIEKKVKN